MGEISSWRFGGSESPERKSREMVIDGTLSAVPQPGGHLDVISVD